MKKIIIYFGLHLLFIYGNCIKNKWDIFFFAKKRDEEET
jgi:hypothetical protein